MISAPTPTRRDGRCFTTRKIVTKDVRNQCAQSTASLHDTDDVSNEGEVHDEETNHEPVAAVNAPVAEPTIEPLAALNAPVVDPTIVRLKRVPLSPKIKKILTFLATAERVEGCSREYAQSWLDFQHAEYGQAAHLLPKDIRTCWSHVATVLYVIIFMYVTINFELSLTSLFL